MKSIIVPAAGIILVIAVSGFGFHTSEYPEGGQQDSTSYQPRKEKLSTFERSFKPSFYDTEVYLYKKSDTLKTFGRSIDNMTSAAPETTQGFRVQLIATNNYDEALSVRNDLLIRYPALWFYTIYEVPAYKIRVGDFVSRAQAIPVLDTFRNEGFKKAWIVPDKVIKNQPPKPPLPIPIDSTAAFDEEENKE